MDLNDLNLCHDTIIYIISLYCSFGNCTNCIYHYNGDTSCLKQDLKKIFNVDTGEIKVKSQDEVMEMFYILWSCVKDECGYSDGCTGCPFTKSGGDPCTRIKMREAMEKYRAKKKGVTYESV